MKILIVNDDSISAPGIAVLSKVASRFGDVTVVAPAEQCSAMSQKLTLRDPLVLNKVMDFSADVQAAYRLGGTPVDCVKVALNYIMEFKPDWVFSGINNGYNVGYDIDYSGTLGAAFEAVRNGIPAMAFSISSEKHLTAVENHLEEIIRILLDKKLESDSVWNVNFPSLTTKPYMGIRWNCQPACVSLYHERYLDEEQTDGSIVLTCKGMVTPDEEIPEGTDAEAVRQGYISVGMVKR